MRLYKNSYTETDKNIRKGNLINMMSISTLYLKNSNKLNENFIKCSKNRNNLIKLEKDRFASIQKNSKKISINQKINRKDEVIRSLYHGNQKIKDDQTSESSFIQGSIFNTKNNFFSNTSTSRELIKNNINNDINEEKTKNSFGFRQAIITKINKINVIIIYNKVKYKNIQHRVDRE